MIERRRLQEYKHLVIKNYSPMQFMESFRMAWFVSGEQLTPRTVCKPIIDNGFTPQRIPDMVVIDPRGKDEGIN